MHTLLHTILKRIAAKQTPLLNEAEAIALACLPDQDTLDILAAAAAARAAFGPITRTARLISTISLQTIPTAVLSKPSIVCWLIMKVVHRSGYIGISLTVMRKAASKILFGQRPAFYPIRPKNTAAAGHSMTVRL